MFAGRGGGERRGRKMPKACSDRSPRTADAEAPARHGRLGMSVFADGKKTERDGRSLCRSVSEDMHGVREADLCLEKTRRAARLIAAAISAGQSGLLCSGLLSVLVFVG